MSAVEYVDEFLPSFFEALLGGFFFFAFDLRMYGSMLKCTVGLWRKLSSWAVIFGSFKRFLGDSGHETGRGFRFKSSRKPLPRNGDSLPPLGLGGRDWFGENSLIIANEAFLCCLGAEYLQ